MVVICVTLRQFFLHDFFAKLAVNLDERIAKSFLILLSKDVAQVMHQACCCKGMDGSLKESMRSSKYFA